MLLIADSGSTKTEWRLVDENGMNIPVRTDGLNPYHVTDQQMKEIIRSQLLPSLQDKKPSEIFFYGSGCGTEEKRKSAAKVLLEIFPGSRTEIHTDLLGAARALCGHEKGLVAILGTGSNSCYYDGEKIATQRPSLGYILGDEGGGAALGKQLLRLHLLGETEMQLAKNFNDRFQLSHADILENIYRRPFPNRFLASFSKFIYQNIGQPQCIELVTKNFRDFFSTYILHYPESKTLPLHVTGSVGFYFSNLLRRVAEEQGIAIGRIAESPAAGLVNYHLERD